MHDNSPFMSDKFCEDIIKRQEHKNKYNENKTYKNGSHYTKQRNHCLIKLKKHKTFFEKLHLKNTGDSKTFEGVAQPYFSNSRIQMILLQLIKKDC